MRIVILFPVFIWVSHLAVQWKDDCFGLLFCFRRIVSSNTCCDLKSLVFGTVSLLISEYRVCQFGGNHAIFMLELASNYALHALLV